MQKFVIIATLIVTIAAAPQSFGQAPITYTQPKITPTYGTNSWASTSQAGSSFSSTGTVDTEVHGGTVRKFGQENTNYGSIDTKYANQAAASKNTGGSATQYSSSVNAPRYDFYGLYGPSSSDQSTAVGDKFSNFSNASVSDTSTVGGFHTSGITTNSFANNQFSSGASTTVTNSNNAGLYTGGSSWSKPATTFY